MKIVRNIAALREAIRGLRDNGKRIALVPTMGALHAGHISLVKEAFKHADSVVVTIFINPTQFGPNEDFVKYPRTEEADIKVLQATNTAIAFLPTIKEIYPQGTATSVHVVGISDELDGAFRPGLFDGVATIVTKLFMQAQPDVAIFGEKDFQQLAVIRRFVADLNIPVKIISAPTMREMDGLAMSSRNRYLSAEERTIAPAMFKLLNAAAEQLHAGGNPSNIITEAKAAMLTAGFTSVDYVALRDAATLAPVFELSMPARLLAAAHIGKTRLIDNIEVLP